MPVYDADRPQAKRVTRDKRAVCAYCNGYMDSPATDFVGAPYHKACWITKSRIAWQQGDARRRERIAARMEPSIAVKPPEGWDQA